MKRHCTRLVVALAIGIALPLPAWAGKKLPEPRRFSQGKEHESLAHTPILRSVPRRVQGQDWGRSNFVSRDADRGRSMPHMSNN